MFICRNTLIVYFPIILVGFNEKWLIITKLGNMELDRIESIISNHSCGDNKRITLNFT